MKYGPLGRSGLIVSRICLGGNSWGAKGRRGWGKFDETEAPAYFRRALATAYALLETGFGPAARRATSLLFMVTRVLAAAVRLAVPAIPSTPAMAAPAAAMTNAGLDCGLSFDISMLPILG